MSVKLIRIGRQLWEAIAVRAYSNDGLVRHLRRKGAQIGDGTRLLTRSLGSEPYLVTIGRECLISVDVVFSTHDGGTWVVRDLIPQLNRFGRIVLGDRVFVGARAVLLPGTVVGDRAVIAAGAVVKGEIPAGAIVAGVPARVVGNITQYAEKSVTESFAVDIWERDRLRAVLGEALPHVKPAQVSSDSLEAICRLRDLPRRP